jgi:hypothetical protein
MDPDVLAALDAIEATLAGRPTDPAQAELAELALLLVAGRPALTADAAERLDERISGLAAPRGGHSWWRGLSRRPAFATAVSALAALAVAVAVVMQSGPDPRVSEHLSAPLRDAAGSPAAGAAAGPAVKRRAPHPAVLAQGVTVRAPARGTPSVVNGAASGALSVPSVPSVPSAPSAGPSPVAHGRKEVQSAQLELVTGAARIDAVSQEVFTVVGQENGIVKRSSITQSGVNSYASFALSIPSGNLSETMSRLSTLRYATVGSRTDNAQDVNNQYLSDQRRLADARALRTSLLKQLAAATTQAEIDSLTARIHDAEASIASDEATLRSLTHQIDFSDLNVQIETNAPPVPVGGHPAHGSGGFTLGQAGHDAVRVLTVAAGVAVIALAALLPIGLLVALGLWAVLTLRRRRREQALDTI